MSKIFTAIFFIIFLSGCRGAVSNPAAEEKLSPERLLENSSGKELSYLVELCQSYGVELGETGYFTVSSRVIYQDASNAILLACPADDDIEAANHGLFIFLKSVRSDWIIAEALWIHERDALEYSIVSPPPSADVPAWFIIKHETSHGMGVRVYSQLCYTLDGREALSFPVYKELTPPGGTVEYEKYPYAVEFTAETSFENPPEGKDSVLLLIKYKISLYNSRQYLEGERSAIKQFNEVTALDWDSAKEEFIFNQEKSSIAFDHPKLNFTDMSEFLAAFN